MTKGWNLGGPNSYERRLANKVSLCLYLISSPDVNFSGQNESGSFQLSFI